MFSGEATTPPEGSKPDWVAFFVPTFRSPLPNPTVDLLLTRAGPSAGELGWHASLIIVPQVRRHLRLSVGNRQVPRLTLLSGAPGTLA
jgi:hypothetical protein